MSILLWSLAEPHAANSIEVKKKLDDVTPVFMIIIIINPPVIALRENNTYTFHLTKWIWPCVWQLIIDKKNIINEVVNGVISKIVLMTYFHLQWPIILYFQ